MTAQELINLLARHYRDYADDETISIGHWSEEIKYQDGTIEFPRLYADIAISVGELRAMANSTSKQGL